MQRALRVLPAVVLLVVGPTVSLAMGGGGGASGGGTGSGAGGGGSTGSGGSGEGTYNLPPELRTHPPTTPSELLQKRIKYGRE